MSDWKAKTPEERADIRGQALMKDVISIAPRDVASVELTISWINRIWNGCMDIAEKRMNDKYPAEPTPKPTVTVTHLSDEQVASGISKEAQRPTQTHYTAPNGKTYAFASDKQSKRAYAIQKGAGWSDYQVKALCQRYGFQSTKKIPVGVYEQFCTDLQNGPGTLNQSSAHLENMAEEVSDAPPF